MDNQQQLSVADGRLLVSQQAGKPDESVIEATLIADGDQTILIIETWSIP